MERRRRRTPKKKRPPPTPHPRHCPPKTKALPKTKDPFLHAPDNKIPSPAKSTRRRSLMGCRERLGGWTEAGRVGGGQKHEVLSPSVCHPLDTIAISPPPPRHHPLPTPPTRPTLPKPTSHHWSSEHPTLQNCTPLARRSHWAPVSLSYYFPGDRRGVVRPRIQAQGPAAPAR